MRVFAVAAVLLLSSSLVPAFAEEAGKAAGSTQPQTVPVQPERSPQQSDQSREEDRRRSEDRQIGSEGQARPSDRDSMGHMDQKDMSRMMEKMGRDMDRDHRTMRMRPEDDRADRDRYGRDNYDEDRPRLRRVKVCFEYENGDEYCRYRR
jgi:hypothetical protein